MAIIIHKLKTLNSKKALAAVLLAGFGALAMSYFPVAANGPQFNIFPISYTGELNHDLPMLDARNVTRGENWSANQADHDAGVAASAGEEIEFSVYFHNGVPDTDENAALNSFVKAFATPSLGSNSTTHRISVQIGAQNAATVSSSDSFHGGDVTVSIQNGQSLPLSLAPGSVFLFPNQGSTPKPSAVNLPNTIFSSGVNIGNVRGCFEFHGFVNFRLQVGAVKPLSVSLQKTVRNVTKNTGFVESVNADPNDEVEFKLVGTNNGQDVIWHMFFSDQLPARLNFVPGSITTSQAIVSGDLFIASGMNIGQASIGQSVTVTFRARVADASQFPIGTTTLTNTGTHWGFGPPTPTRTVNVTDTAQVVVVKQQPVVSCDFTWNAPTTSDSRGLRRVGDAFNVSERVAGLSPFANFNIVHQHVSGSPIFRYPKNADSFGGYMAFNSNITQASYVTGDYNAFVEVNGVNVATCRGFRLEPAVVQQIDIDKTVGGTIFSDQIQIQPAQRVTFRLVVSPLASNIPLTNVVIRDTLPAKMSFVSGTFNLNGTNQSEGSFFTSGLNIGSLQPGSQVTVTFQADAVSAANFVTGSCEDLINAAFVNSGSLSDQDTATVRVCKPNPTKQPGSPGPRPQ